MSERSSGTPSGRPDGSDAVDVFDAAVLDRTLAEDWSRYTGPAADVRARGLQMRRARRLQSFLGVAGVLAVTAVVIGLAGGRGGLAAPARPAAGAPVPSAIGSPTPPDPADPVPAGLVMNVPAQLLADDGTKLVLADAVPLGKGEVDGHDWQVFVRVFASRRDLAAQAPGIERLAAPGTDGPIALIANYEHQRLGGARVLALGDSAPIIPDGRGTAVDPWFSSASGVVTGEVGAAVATLRVTAGGRETDYAAASIGGYRFIAFPVSAAAPVTRIVALDGTGKQIGSESGRFIPGGVFDSAHPELNFGSPPKKS